MCVLKFVGCVKNDPFYSSSKTNSLCPSFVELVISIKMLTCTTFPDTLTSAQLSGNIYGPRFCSVGCTNWFCVQRGFIYSQSQGIVFTDCWIQQPAGIDRYFFSHWGRVCILVEFMLKLLWIMSNFFGPRHMWHEFFVACCISEYTPWVHLQGRLAEDGETTNLPNYRWWEPSGSTGCCERVT